MTHTLLVAVPAAALLGYAAGRLRPGRLLVDWAADQTSTRTMRSPQVWVAAPIVLVAIARMRVLHRLPSVALNGDPAVSTPTPHSETTTRSRNTT